MSIRLKTMLGVALIEALLLTILITFTLSYLESTNYDGLQKRAQTTIALFATMVKIQYWLTIRPVSILPPR